MIHSYIKIKLTRIIKQLTIILVSIPKYQNIQMYGKANNKIKILFMITKRKVHSRMPQIINKIHYIQTLFTLRISSSIEEINQHTR